MVLEPATATTFEWRPYKLSTDRDSAPVAPITSVRTIRTSNNNPEDEALVTPRAELALRNAGVVYLVTVVDADGREYNYGRPMSASGCYNFSAIKAYAEIKWQASAEAASYRVYRSAIQPRVDPLYTPGSPEATAEADRLKVKTATFTLPLASNQSLTYVSPGHEVWNTVALSGNTVAGIAERSTNNIRIPVDCVVSISFKWPIVVNSITDPDTGTTEDGLKHDFHIRLVHKNASGTELPSSAVWRFNSDSDLGTPYLAHAEFQLADIRCETGDIFHYKLALDRMWLGMLVILFLLVLVMKIRGLCFIQGIERRHQ